MKKSRLHAFLVLAVLLAAQLCSLLSNPSLHGLGEEEFGAVHKRQLSAVLVGHRVTFSQQQRSRPLPAFKSFVLGGIFIPVWSHMVSSSPHELVCYRSDFVEPRRWLLLRSLLI